MNLVPDTERFIIGQAHVRAAGHVLGWAKELAAHPASEDVADKIEHVALLMHSHGTSVVTHPHVPVEHLANLRTRLRQYAGQLPEHSAAISSAGRQITRWCAHLDGVHARLLASMEVAG